MERVTEKDLERIVARINREMGTPLETYTGNSSNPGNYHLDYAYGGVTLSQIVGTAGGARSVLSVGYVSKRELRALMFAYLQGIDDSRRQSVKAA